MKSKIALFICSFMHLVLPTSGQGIKGKITNTQGEAVPFATIYVPNLSTGTTSNMEGNYELKLPEGKWSVQFQYLGYQSQTKEISVDKTTRIIDVRLLTQNYRIPEIIVMASGQDPAYSIMRRAIAMAPYYQHQVSKYSCKVYLKGSGIFEKIPFLMERQMKKEGLSENQPFVMETLSKIDFELPDKVNQEVLSMRSSGKGNNTSPMMMITNNLYDAEKYGVVSPVSKNAFKVYNFSLEGIFEDQGHTINKIKVIPKTNGNDVFSGYIYIADLFWNIHSADLKLHIPMTDVAVHQVYAEVNKHTWMPVSLDFDMDFAGFGFKVRYKYVASISEYKTTLNQALDHSILDKMQRQMIQEQQVEAVVTSKDVNIDNKQKVVNQKQMAALMDKKELTNRETKKLNKLVEAAAKRNAPPEPLEIKSTFKVSPKQVNNDSAYWSTVRPIPLTSAETKSFAKKDSYTKGASSPSFQDSIRDSKRKFRVKHIIIGQTYDYSVDTTGERKMFTIPNLLNPTSFSFNSVDGLRMELPFNFYHSDSTGRFLGVAPQLSYAFLRRKMDGSVILNRRLQGLSNIHFSVALGSITQDYSRVSGVTTLTNELYTLFDERNLKRYYRRDFVNISGGRDLVNGLILNASIDYSHNYQLENHTTYSFIDRKDRQILPNIPANSEAMNDQLDGHRSLIARISLDYTPHNRYRIRNNVKYYETSKYPTFSLVYRGGINSIAGSESRFDLFKLGIRQRSDFGINNNIFWQLSVGKFLNHNHIYFEDFEHFKVVATEVLFSSTSGCFRLLPDYLYATAKQFAESHIELNTRRLILKQLPVIKNSSITEKLFFNYLATPEIRNYAETGYGIGNLFLFLSVEAVAGFEDGKFKSAGIRIGLNLK